MIPLTPLAVLFALAGPPAPPCGPTECRLRNVAAADAAAAVDTFARAKKWDVTVSAEPVTNVVRLAGDLAHRTRAVELLTSLDIAPPQFCVEVLIVQTPGGFTKQVGLAEGNESQWVLTPRESKLLAAAVSRTARAKEGDILSRPTLTVVDNQTGFFQIGDSDHGLVIRATPRLTPDGASVLLRLESQLTTPNQGAGFVGRDIQSLQTTGRIPVGGTLVVRGQCPSAAAGQVNELLLIATVNRVAAAPAVEKPTVSAAPVAQPGR